MLPCAFLRWVAALCFCVGRLLPSQAAAGVQPLLLDTLCCASLARPDGADPPNYMRTMLQGDYEGAMQAAQRCYFTALQREGEGSCATLPHAVRFGVMLLGGWHGPLCLCIAPSGLSGGALPVPRGSASCFCMCHAALLPEQGGAGAAGGTALLLPPLLLLPAAPALVRS